MPRIVGQIILTLFVIREYNVLYDVLIFFSENGGTHLEILLLFLSIILTTMVWIFVTIYIGKKDDQEIQKTDC